MNQFLFEKKTLIFFFVILALYHLLGLIYSLYYIFWWYDVLAHFGGGVLTAMIFWRFFKNKISGLSAIFQFLFLVSFVALIGVFWEFFEKFLDSFFKFNYQGDVNDTLLDLAMDILGGFFVGIFGFSQGFKNFRS
jgi:hypothetical protein